MQVAYNKIHNRFKLNGISFSREELKEVAYSLIKEGAPWELSMGDFLLDWLSDVPTLEVMTSGSTGKPKRLTLQKQAMVNSALATGDFFGLEVGDTALLCLPTNYIAGKMMLVRAMILGLELYYVEPTAQPLQAARGRYHFVAMVPLQLAASLDELPRIKKLIVGGAPIPHALKEKIGDMPTAIYETYGMTETITHIAAKKITGPDRPFTILPGVVISKDERDCLVINAPHLLKETIPTNDVVDLVSETEFQWLGRYDNIINSGGVKLLPETIEAKLSPFVENRFFVAGLPDSKLGEKLVLVVEGAPEEDLLAKLKASKKLKAFEVPKEVVAVEKFEETKNGKILRAASLALLA
ncbi:AMP-binding protein [Flavobacteriaceae bacterium 3-367]